MSNDKQLAILEVLVEKMQGVPRFNEMCTELGIPWDEVQDIIRDKGREWGVMGQQILNFVMLGASIGYLYNQKQVSDATQVQ
jgi:hypothetical protein